VLGQPSAPRAAADTITLGGGSEPAVDEPAPPAEPAPEPAEPETDDAP